MRAEIEHWLQAISASVPHTTIGIVAWNIGLYETPNGFGLYLAGSTHFDASDDDWACEPAFVLPENHLVVSPDCTQLTWQQVEQVVLEVLANWVTSAVFKESVFARAQAITTGFDGGDLHRIL